ncbi:MAG: hypothetical protein HFE63_10035 [Clostridiales bacterium]|nr:hypothetical protein [Clostridiales bacterium]
MKKYKITLTALAAAMLMSFPLNALSYTGLGEIDSLMRDTIGDKLTYTEFKSTDQSGRTQNSYIFEYDPSGDVLPLVRYGATIYGKDRLGALVSSEKNSGSQVLGAINGDFYSMQTGVPLGVMIDGGRLVSTDDSKYAVGFTSDGRAIIGKPSVKLSLVNLTRGWDAVEIDQLNKFPTIWGVYMVTDDFASTTLSASESLEIVIELDGDIKASGSVSGRVRDVVRDDCNTNIPKGCAVITIANTFEDYPLFANLEVGDEVRIDTTCEAGWEDVVTAIGGGDLILSDGVLPDGTIDEAHEKVSNPRTAVGIKPDGKVVFFAVDGRSSSSRGLTEAELSAVMSELGCVTALNLDGGGSTTVMVKGSTSTDCVYVNSPSDGSYRSLSNGLLFVSRESSDGIAAALSPIPNTPYLLRYSTINFVAQPLDRAYVPVGEQIGSDQLSIMFDPNEVYANNVGSVSGAAFTAGGVAGEYKFIISTTNENPIYGNASVVVVDHLDDVIVEPANARILPGSIVPINVTALYKGRSVIHSADSFYYTLNGTHIESSSEDYPGAMLVCDLGYLDVDGNFHAFAGVSGDVEIGVWYDEFVRYVKLHIGDGSDVVSDFEDAADIGNFSVSAGKSVNDMYFSPSDGGYKSESALTVGYSFENSSVERLVDVKLRSGFPISPDAQSIKLWISGDVSGNMTASVADVSGNIYDISYVVTKDYSRQNGWRELTAVIPASLKNGTLTLESVLSINDLGRADRTIKLDNIMVYYGEEEDIPLNGLDGHWSKDYILRLYDMGVIEDSDCDNVDGTLVYSPSDELSRGEFTKLLLRWMGINASAYAEQGIVLEADTPADKLAYIRAAIANGIMNGYGIDENGVWIFNANAPITRQEAFKVIGSLLDNSEVILKFADSIDIQDWAYSGIAKCVAAGAVNGYEDNTIRPNANISRGELAAILSRIG